MSETTTPSSERETMTMEEARQVLGLGRSSIFRAAARGEVPTIRIGRRVLVPRAALDRLLQTTAPAIK